MTNRQYISDYSRDSRLTKTTKKSSCHQRKIMLLFFFKADGSRLSNRRQKLLTEVFNAQRFNFQNKARYSPPFQTIARNNGRLNIVKKNEIKQTPEVLGTMKQKVTISFIIFLLIGFLHLDKIFGIQENTRDKDSFGKIVGQVVSETTGKPVNEAFIMIVYDASFVSEPRFLYNIESDKNGNFSDIMLPGKYFINFAPVSETSIYCYDLPLSMLKNKNPKQIEIKKGQVTRFIKKAKLGGSLKIVLVDQNGKRINPNLAFIGCNTKRIKDTISFVRLPDEMVDYNTKKGDYLDDGEKTLFCLHPENYTLRVTFSDIGYAPVEMKDVITISSGQLVEQSIIIDLKDNTGIQGKIVSQSGKILKNAKITLEKNDESQYFVHAKTHDDGMYKIVGLKQGIYSLSVTIDISDTRWITKDIKNINITSNNIVRIDVVVDKIM